MKRYIGILLFLFSLFGCEPDSKRITKLREQMKQSRAATKELIKKQQDIVKDLKDNWVRSLHYRLPSVQPITPEEISVNIPELPYLKSIRFKYLNKHNQIQLKCNFLAQKKGVKVLFYVHLFDDNGVDVHYEKVVHKNFLRIERPLPKGKPVEKKYKISYLNQSPPTQFFVQVVK